MPTDPTNGRTGMPGNGVSGGSNGLTGDETPDRSTPSSGVGGAGRPGAGATTPGSTKQDMTNATEPPRFLDGEVDEFVEGAERIQDGWDQDELDRADDIEAERLRGEYVSDNERADAFGADHDERSGVQQAIRDGQVAEANETVDEYRENQAEHGAEQLAIKEAEMAEAHARGEAYFWGETTYDGTTVEKWILPDGTELLVDGEQIVSVDYPDGMGPVFLGEVAYQGEMVGVYEMPSGAVVVVDGDGNLVGEIDDVALDTVAVPGPDGDLVEVYLVPNGPPTYDTTAYDVETGEQVIGYNTGRGMGAVEQLSRDMVAEAGASVYYPPGTDYAYVIDADGNIVDVYTVPPELEWSLFGIVEYYEDGTVSIDLAVVEIDVDLVGPEKGISVSVDLLLVEGTAGISWDDEGNWEFDVSAEFDVGVAEGGADISVGQEDGNFFVDAAAWGAVMVGPLTVDGNIGASFVQTDDGWGASVTAGAGVSMGGARAGAQAAYTVVKDGEGVTKTFQMTGVLEMDGLGSLEVTGQYQQTTDNDGDKDSTTSAQGVVRDEDGNEVASAGELEDDNWPEDGDGLPTGPGDAAAGAGFDLDRDEESAGSDGSRNADDTGRAGLGGRATGALGEREDGPARPGIAAAGDRGTGPRLDDVYIQEIPSGLVGQTADGAARSGPGPLGGPFIGETEKNADADDVDGGPRPDGPRPDGPRPDGPRPDGPRPDGPFGGPESLPTQTPRTAAATTADRQVDLESPTSVDPGGEGRPLGGERPGLDFVSTASGSPNIRTDRPDGLPPTDTTLEGEVDLGSPTSVDRGGEGRPLGGERPGFDFVSTAGGSPNVRSERPDGLPPTDTTLEGEVSIDDPTPARTVDDVTSLPPTDTTLEREVSFDSPTAAGGRPGNLVEGRAGLPDDIADIPRGPATRPGAGQDVGDPVTGVRADGGVHVRNDDGQPPSGEPPSDRPPSEPAPPDEPPPSDGSDPDRPPAETLPLPSPGPERFDDIVGVGASSPSASARAGREDRSRDDAGHDRGPVVDVGPDESQPADPQPTAATEYVDLGTVDVEVASPSMVELEIEERPDARFGGRFEADIDDGRAFLDGPDAEPMT